MSIPALNLFASFCPPPLPPLPQQLRPPVRAVTVSSPQLPLPLLMPPLKRVTDCSQAVFYNQFGVLMYHHPLVDCPPLRPMAPLARTRTTKSKGKGNSSSGKHSEKRRLKCRPSTRATKELHVQTPLSQQPCHSSRPVPEPVVLGTASSTSSSSTSSSSESSSTTPSFTSVPLSVGRPSPCLSSASPPSRWSSFTPSPPPPAFHWHLSHGASAVCATASATKPLNPYSAPFVLCASSGSSMRSTQGDSEEDCGADSDCSSVDLPATDAPSSLQMVSPRSVSAPIVSCLVWTREAVPPSACTAATTTPTTESASFSTGTANTGASMSTGKSTPSTSFGWVWTRMPTTSSGSTFPTSKPYPTPKTLVPHPTTTTGAPAPQRLALLRTPAGQQYSLLAGVRNGPVV